MAMASTMWPPRDMRSPGDMPTRPAISGMLGSTATSEMAPSRLILTIDLVPSNRALVPKMFLAPWSGLRRLGSGLSAFGVILGRTIARVTTTAATMAAPPPGRMPLGPPIPRRPGQEALEGAHPQPAEQGSEAGADGVVGVRGQRQRVLDRVRQAVEQGRAGRGEREDRGHQDDGAAEVGALGDLALLTRLLAALGCCLLGLVVGHGSGSP